MRLCFLGLRVQIPLFACGYGETVDTSGLESDFIRVQIPLPVPLILKMLALTLTTDYLNMNKIRFKDANIIRKIQKRIQKFKILPKINTNKKRSILFKHYSYKLNRIHYSKQINNKLNIIKFKESEKLPLKYLLQVEDLKNYSKKILQCINYKKVVQKLQTKRKKKNLLKFLQGKIKFYNYLKLKLVKYLLLKNFEILKL